MSLLKDNNPLNTRNRFQPKKKVNKLSEVSSEVKKPKSPEPKEEKPRIEDMIKEYGYIEGKTPVIEKPHRHSTFLNLWNLNYLCEERIQHMARYGLPNKLYKIEIMREEVENKSAELFSDNIEILEYKGLQFRVATLDGIPILTERLKNMSGFLREYFNYKEVYILYNTGELKLEKSNYCVFWHEERLQKYLERNFQPLIHSEIFNTEACKNCQVPCQFRG